MEKEKLVEALVNETNGDKAKALAQVIAAETEKETETLKVESQEKVSKKDRILGIFKVIGTILLGLFTGGVAIFNARSVMKFEETGTIRSKAWTGVKPDKQPEIR